LHFPGHIRGDPAAGVRSRAQHEFLIDMRLCIQPQK
jgi:hypothetical protein